MTVFPKLKTGAVAQYPATKGIRFRNQVCRFVDGNEQRYRDAAGPLHQWTIRLDQLDETEAASVESFFVANQGNFGNFGFVDPWDNTLYPNCSLADDVFAVKWTSPMRGATTLTVIENRT